ncbi:hypothetical protein HYV80_06675 [Candidatus Woesearchaeota archaeon]|nr:hypothetical protein [Candidatus Woesearchaeota archaeon]
MMKFDSAGEWKSYCFNTHKAYLKSKYFRCWLREKKIDVFNYSSLNKKDESQIMKTIGNMLKICSPGSKIRMFRRKFSELGFAARNGSLSGEKILKMAKKSRIKNKNCNAGIFLVNSRASSGKNLLNFGDALTYVSDGVVIFTFDPSVRYPKRFFKREVAHEICHLLGLNAHHKDTAVKGYGKEAKCIMDYNAPSEVLCNKCKDGLLSFWDGVNHAAQQ